MKSNFISNEHVQIAQRTTFNYSDRLFWTYSADPDQTVPEGAV